jgi:DsbC/DsbD-like thiol-disulfide interchange protein
LGLALLAALLLLGPASAQVKKSSDAVKVEARADKPAADGTQVVILTLKIEKGWHLYANPVGYEDLKDSETTVSFGGTSKPEVVKLEYPTGKVVKDKALMAEYRTYEDTVTIKATVRRAKGDAGPLDVTIRLQACDARKCLPRDTVKVKVP